MGAKNILVASHPRSGTNFTLNTIALNFGYPRYRPLPDNPAEIKINTERKLFKTHLAYYKLVGTDAIMCKKIYVSREIKDTLVSMYHCDMGEGGINMDKHSPRMSFQEWLRSNPSEKWGIKADTWAEEVYKHRQSWKAVKDCLYITYEELSTEFIWSVQKISDFLQQEPLEFPLAEPLKSDCVRPYKGIIGAWKEHFTDDDLNIVKPYDIL